MWRANCAEHVERARCRRSHRHERIELTKGVGAPDAGRFRGIATGRSSSLGAVPDPIALVEAPMDDGKLGQLSRDVGTAGSRRQALRLLAGAALAAPLALLQPGQASAQAIQCKRRCFEGQVCRNGGCRNGRLERGDPYKRKEPLACRSGECRCRPNRRRIRDAKPICLCR